MKKFVIPVIIAASFSAVSLTAYAQSSLLDGLKTIIGEDNPIDVDQIGKNLSSGISSVLSDVKDGVVSIKSSVEDEVAKEAQLLASKGVKGVKDSVEDGIPIVIENLKKAVEQTPTDVKLLIKLAVAYKLGGEYSLALTVAEKALTYDPDNEDAAIIKAESLNLKGEVDKSIQFLQGFTQEKVNDPKLRTYLASLRAETGDTGKAVSDMETAILTKPRDPELYKKLGEILVKDNQKGIKLYTEGHKVDFSKYSNVEPILRNGSTLIPIRALADNIGAQISYDFAASTVKIKTDAKEMLLVRDKNTAKVNSKEIKMAEPAREINGRMLIPMRFVSEQLGREVGWYPYSKYGIISVNKKSENQ